MLLWMLSEATGAVGSVNDKSGHARIRTSSKGASAAESCVPFLLTPIVAVLE